MKNSNNPLVSVIIVNYNGKIFLEDCFKSLSKVNYPNFEIILVDNNSTDDSIEYVKNNFPSTIIIKLEKNYGFAYPNNVGAKNTKGEFLLFLNNDTVVKPSFMEELVNVLKNNSKIGICQSILLKPNGEIDSSGDFIDSIGVSYSSKKKVEDITKILSAKAASMIIRKELFEKLNGFDEKFFASFEDVDIGWRSWISGHNVVINPRSIVYHKVGQTSKKIGNELAFHGFKNQLSMKITNFETKLVGKKIFLFFVLYGLRMIRVWFDYKIKGHTSIMATPYEEKIAQHPKLSIIFRGIFWNCRNFSYLWKKHKIVKKSRTCSTKDLEKLNLIIPRK